MTIPTQMSLHGFLATAPALTFIGNREARFQVPGRHRAVAPNRTVTSRSSTRPSVTWSRSADERKRSV